MMGRKLKKGFVEATSNPDPRNAPPGARRRSRGKVFRAEGTTGAAHGGLKQAQAWGIPSLPVWLHHTVLAQRETEAWEEEKVTRGQTDDPAGLWTLLCELWKSLRGF